MAPLVGGPSAIAPLASAQVCTRSVAGLCVVWCRSGCTLGQGPVQLCSHWISSLLSCFSKTDEEQEPPTSSLLTPGILHPGVHNRPLIPANTEIEKSIRGEPVPTLDKAGSVGRLQSTPVSVRESAVHIGANMRTGS